MVQLAMARLTSQGQVSIPKKVRDHMCLAKGGRIVFLEDEAGHIYIQEVEEPFGFGPKDWEAFLAKSGKEPVTRTHGAEEALAHLDQLTKKKK